MRIKQSAADWRAVYDRFLSSPEWKRKRALVLKRANNWCEACLEKHAQEVHHTIYPQPVTFAALCAQPAWQLRATCQDCHDLIHGRPLRSAATKTTAPWLTK